MTSAPIITIRFRVTVNEKRRDTLLDWTPIGHGSVAEVGGGHSDHYKEAKSRYIWPVSIDRCLNASRPAGRILAPRANRRFSFTFVDPYSAQE